MHEFHIIITHSKVIVVLICICCQLLFSYGVNDNSTCEFIGIGMAEGIQGLN